MAAERLYLVHLLSGDTVSAQFNPTEFKESVEAVWEHISIPGESHEPMEYSHTKNHECSFELGFDATSGQGITFGGSLQGSQFLKSEDPLLVRRFLMACQYTMKNAATIRSAAPSKILVVWPGFYSLAMRLLKVEFTHRQWAATNGPPILFSASLKFEADSDRRLHYEDVLAHGTIRNEAG